MAMGMRQIPDVHSPHGYASYMGVSDYQIMFPVTIWESHVSAYQIIFLLTGFPILRA